MLTALAQDPSAAGMSSAFRMQHVLSTGDLTVLTPDEFAVLDSAPDVPMVLLSRALVALLFGRTEEAAARHAELRARLEDPDFARSSGVARSMVVLVEEFGDVETATRSAALIAATPFDIGGSGIYCCGSSASDLGRLAVVLGRLDEAVERFEEAMAIDARVGARPAAVLDGVQLAAALVARDGPGDPARALGLARAAAAEARRLGMPGPLHRADALIERANALSRSADPLTAREREIADLVAGVDQPADRRAAGALGADGGEPRAQHPGQARSGEPHRDRDDDSEEGVDGAVGVADAGGDADALERRTRDSQAGHLGDGGPDGRDPGGVTHQVLRQSPAPAHQPRLHRLGRDRPRGPRRRRRRPR